VSHGHRSIARWRQPTALEEITRLDLEPHRVSDPIRDLPGNGDIEVERVHAGQQRNPVDVATQHPVPGRALDRVPAHVIGEKERPLPCRREHSDRDLDVLEVVVGVVPKLDVACPAEDKSRRRPAVDAATKARETEPAVELAFQLVGQRGLVRTAGDLEVRPNNLVAVPASCDHAI